MARLGKRRLDAAGFHPFAKTSNLDIVKKLHTLVHRVEGWLLAVAVLWMALATIANVIVRNWTGDSLAATEELNQFLIVLIGFVGLSYAAGEGRHIRMSALSDALPVTLRRRLPILVSSLTAGLLLYLAWFAAQYVLDVDRRSPVLDVPLRLVYGVAPVGLFLGALHYAMAALQNLTARDGRVYVAWGVPDQPEEPPTLEGD